MQHPDTCPPKQSRWGLFNLYVSVTRTDVGHLFPCPFAKGLPPEQTQAPDGSWDHVFEFPKGHCDKEWHSTDKKCLILPCRAAVGVVHRALHIGPQPKGKECGFLWDMTIHRCWHLRGWGVPRTNPGSCQGTTVLNTVNVLNHWRGRLIARGKWR